MTIYKGENYFFFIMTSGLRSLRDKTLVYFEEAFEHSKEGFDHLYKVVNCISEQIRQVYKEDSEPLKEAGLQFNMHMLIGGQLGSDREHQLFFIYPQGNWVIVGQGTPYQIIGAAPYGKPILDRTLKYTDSIPFALKVGTLAFDSTRISAADVDYPIDIVLYRKDSFDFVERCLGKDDLKDLSEWWQGRLRNSIDSLPSEWIKGLSDLVPEPVIKKLKKNNSKKVRSINQDG